MALLLASRKTLLSARAYDSSASDFFARAGVASDAQKTAINTLVLALKAADLWGMYYALYPFIGGTAASHSQNLISSSYPITWTGAVTHDADGITGDGSTGWGTCTGLTGTVATHLCGLTIYVRVNDDAASAHVLGGLTDAGGTIWYSIDRLNGTANRFCMGAVANYASETAAARTGNITANRVSTTSAIAADDGTQWAAYATSDSSTPPVGDFKVLAVGGSGTPFPSAANIALFGVAQGMTAGQVTTLTPIIETYQDALGRGAS